MQRSSWLTENPLDRYRSCQHSMKLVIGNRLLSITITNYIVFQLSNYNYNYFKNVIDYNYKLPLQHHWPWSILGRLDYGWHRAMADDEIEWTTWQKGTQLITHYLYDPCDKARSDELHGFPPGVQICTLRLGPVFTWSLFHVVPRPQIMTHF